MNLNSNHYIHLADGKFDSTTLSDLDKAFEAFKQSESPSGWVIHFHGGMVSERSAREAAEALIPAYRDAGAYPFFFIWESGLIETVVNNLGDIAREPFFRKVTAYLIEYLLSKLSVRSPTAAESLASPTPPHEDVERFLTRQNAAIEETVRIQAPYDEITASDVDGNVEDITLDAKELEALMARDPEVVRAVQQINRELQSPTGNAGLQEGITYRTPGHLTPRALQELTGMHEHPQEVPHVQEAIFGITLGRVAWTAAGIGIRVLRRFAKGRDHGLYTTVVEEVLRNLYIDDIGSTVFWNRMKGDTSDAFQEDPGRYGGTAFLQRLCQLANENAELPRVTLVGHSAGAIFVSHFLGAADGCLPESVKFDVILLAPAVDFELFTKAIETNRIANIRMFAMSDDRESTDALSASLAPNIEAVRYLYPRSLLYFVSGLLETEVDRPLLGMQRYHIADEYTGRRFSSVTSIRSYFSNIPNSRIWSPSMGNDPGLNTDSSRHGDFDREDPATLESIVHILREGFGRRFDGIESPGEEGMHPQLSDVIDEMSDQQAIAVMLNFNADRRSSRPIADKASRDRAVKQSMPTVTYSQALPDGELAKLTLKLLAKKPLNHPELQRALEQVDDSPNPVDIENDEFVLSLSEDVIAGIGDSQIQMKMQYPTPSYELSELVSQLSVRGEPSELTAGGQFRRATQQPSFDSDELRVALSNVSSEDLELISTRMFGLRYEGVTDDSEMVNRIVDEVGRDGKTAEDVLVQVHQIVPYVGLVQRYLMADEKTSNSLRESLTISLNFGVSEGMLPEQPSQSMTIRLSSPDVDLRGIPGLEVLTQLESIVVARGGLESLNALEANPDVLSVEESTRGGRSECVVSMVDVKAIAAKNTTREFGEQCLVAIIDGGIDVLHQAFQTLDESHSPKTRLKGIWDMTSNAGSPPAGFESVGGTFHSEDEINEYLQLWHDHQTWENPKGLKRDPRGHGTHVASIAAGTQPADSIQRNQFPGGVAHAAPLLIVVTGRDQFEAGSPAHIGYSESHVAALKFIDGYATNKSLPFVVNISQGEHAGAHDGTTALEVAIDEMTQMGRRPGVVVVKSAGNDRANLGHAYFTMGSKFAEKLEWNSDFRDGWPPGRSHDLIEIWFKPSAKLSFQLINPDDEVSTTVNFIQSPTVVSGTFANGNAYRMEYARRFRDNGHGRLRVEIRGSETPGSATAIREGKWQLDIINFEDSLAQEIHAWVERSTDWQPVRFVNFPSVDSTITVPGTAHSVITVGSVKLDPDTAIMRVSDFSGFGKTRDGRNKPEIVAPGIQIKAAKSASEFGLVASDGTSMAAPHVSGAIALVLSNCKKRSTQIPTANEIRLEIAAMANSQWNRGLGYGLLDVEALLDRFQ